MLKKWGGDFVAVKCFLCREGNGSCLLIGKGLRQSRIRSESYFTIHALVEILRALPYHFFFFKMESLLPPYTLYILHLFTFTFFFHFSQSEDSLKTNKKKKICKLSYLKFLFHLTSFSFFSVLLST